MIGVKPVMPPAVADAAAAGAGLAFRYSESPSEIKDDIPALLSCLVSMNSDLRAYPAPAVPASKLAYAYQM